MNKRGPNYGFYLFNCVMLVVGLFLSLAVSSIVVYSVDLIVYSPNSPKMSYLAQKAYNADIMLRVGYKVFWVSFIITFVSLAGYYCFKIFRKSKR